jgi:hypothetical protein
LACAVKVSTDVDAAPCTSNNLEARRAIGQEGAGVFRALSRFDRTCRR